MNRALCVLNLVLLVSVVLLQRFDASLEARREAQRAADSAFHALSEPEVVAVTDVRRIDLILPDSGTKWTYVLREDGWHMPQHRDGFALGGEIEGFLKAVLESRGTVVGRVPSDSEHFGFAPGRTVEAELFDASGGLRLRAICGSVAPGQRSTECFLSATGRDTILHMRSNPRPYVQWNPESRLPPLLDTRVIPLTLGRGLPSKISFGGEGAPAVREMTRREIPVERRLEMRPYRGPAFEWFGTIAEGERRINDHTSFAYSSFLSNLLFDELLGRRSERDSVSEKPWLTIAIEYDGARRDTLSVWPETDGGLYFLHHSTTDQLFLIAEEKARGLVPDAAALLKLEPPMRAPEQAPPDTPPLPEVQQRGEQ